MSRKKIRRDRMQDKDPRDIIRSIIFLGSLLDNPATIFEMREETHLDDSTIEQILSDMLRNKEIKQIDMNTITGYLPHINFKQERRCES